MIDVVAYGTPAPQGSKRHVGNGVMVESSKRLRPWRQDVKAAAEAARRATGPIDAPVRLRMVWRGEVSESIAQARARMTPAVGSRVPCGAKRHRDGKPCEALSEPGKRRCRFHGGRSTGPRTEAGKARALANLRRGRNSLSERIAQCQIFSE